MRLVSVIDAPPVHYERLAIGTLAAVALNEDYAADARIVFITVEDNNIRYRIDGGDPDINDGHLVYAAGNFYIANRTSVQQLRMIAIGGNATAIITYYN